MRQISGFLFTYIGARIWWLLKGRKVSFNDEMSGQSDHDLKYYRNWLTGLVFVFGILLLAYAILK